MAEGKKVTRLSKAAKEFNVGTSTIVEFLSKKGYEVENNPNAKISYDAYEILKKEYKAQQRVKEESQKIGLKFSSKKKRQPVQLKENAPVEEDVESSDDSKDYFVKNNTPGMELSVKKEEDKKDLPKKDTEKTGHTKSETTPSSNLDSNEKTDVSEKKPEPKYESEEKKETKKNDSVSSAEPAAVKENRPEEKISEKISKENSAQPNIEPDKKDIQKQDQIKPSPEKDQNIQKDKVIQKEKAIIPKETPKEDVPVESPSENKEVVEKNLHSEKSSEKKESLQPKSKKDAEIIPEKKKEEEKAAKHADHRKHAASFQKNQNVPAKGSENSAKKASETVKESVADKEIHDDRNTSVNEQEEMKKSHQTEKTELEKTKKVEKQPKKTEGHKVEEKEKKGYPDNFIPTEVEKLSGPKILDKIDLSGFKKKTEKKPVASSKDDNKENQARKKKKRRRIPNKARTGEAPSNIVTKVNTANKPNTNNKDGNNKGGGSGVGKPTLGGPKKNHNNDFRNRRFNNKRGGHARKDIDKPELTKEDIDKQIKETMARLNSQGKSKGSKHRRQKRDANFQNRQEEILKKQAEKSTIKVTEFVTANELATMMEVQVNEIIATCMSLGLVISINQRLDAETINILADEFGYKVEFVSVDVQEAIEENEVVDSDEDLSPRHPVVTVMGHVDHGKTLLLDYIRKSNVVAGEAGGITQHIGAYEVILEDERKITFLDTPGHEAFTAMRARGAKVTDVAIVIIAADDNVMPQTKEAINHAQAAGVPIVFAINKVDKPTANPERIRQELAEMNILVEDWGGKYQVQEISAKTGMGISELLEKVSLEAELLELRANPDRLAKGTVIESSLDKGRGYIAKILVQNGTLKIGDGVLAGSYFGKVKAMHNERNLSLDEAGPSTPLLLLGLSGAPQAGDTFNVMTDEREAKAIATKRQQLQREQGMRTQKHITLDEIGRRIAIGDFKELNIIVKADVDGSVEALSDSLLKLTTEEVQVNVIHKSVGAITESDVLLASASNAIIIGFQVRPTTQARKIAEHEQIDIRQYSIIYQAIEEIKSAIEGMLSPEIEEKIIANLEIRDVFKITKVGTVAGCMVLDGKITRNTKIRLIRDGIVVYTGLLGSLKRFKDDVKEVQAGYECGLNIDNFNDMKVGDIVEGYEEIEIARKLS
ncbi:MAG: translation initiation factor IF-2 [Bacteroidales bacterium]